jgi:predicted transcriptional regulator
MLTKPKRHFSFYIAMNGLKAARERLELRAEVVAGKALISLAYYRKLEEGTSNPTLPVARRVARALEQTLEELWPDDPADDVVAPEAAGSEC